MIDINKKLMLVIVTPSGEVDVNYFDDYPDNLHYKILRNYIYNKATENSFSLNYDLKNADKLWKVERENRIKQGEDGSRLLNFEFRLDQLSNILNKNGYLLLFDMYDYRQDFGSSHSGMINLPEELENLSNIHKQILKNFSNYIEVNKTAFYKNPDKIVFYDLPVYYYDKIKKDQCEIGSYYDIFDESYMDNETKRAR